jgi:hypothetical protein
MMADLQGQRVKRWAISPSAREIVLETEMFDDDFVRGSSLERFKIVFSGVRAYQLNGEMECSLRELRELTVNELARIEDSRLESLLQWAVGESGEQKVFRVESDAAMDDFIACRDCSIDRLG